MRWIARLAVALTLSAAAAAAALTWAGWPRPRFVPFDATGEAVFVDQRRMPHAFYRVIQQQRGDPAFWFLTDDGTLLGPWRPGRRLEPHGFDAAGRFVAGPVLREFAEIDPPDVLLRYDPATGVSEAVDPKAPPDLATATAENSEPPVPRSTSRMLPDDFLGYQQAHPVPGRAAAVFRFDEPGVARPNPWFDWLTRQLGRRTDAGLTTCRYLYLDTETGEYRRLGRVDDGPQTHAVGPHDLAILTQRFGGSRLTLWDLPPARPPWAWSVPGGVAVGVLLTALGSRVLRRPGGAEPGPGGGVDAKVPVPV